MKHIIITILCTINTLFLIAQIDTIYYLTEGETTVFAFDSEPTFMNVSIDDITLKEDYNTILLLPHRTFTTATLVVEIDSIFHTIKLGFTNDKDKVTYFQNFKVKTLDNGDIPISKKETAEKRYVQGNQHIITPEILERVSNKLKAFRNNEIKGTKLLDTRAITTGFQSNLVLAFVDQDHFYFRFRLKNKQSIIYDLNPVTISYEGKQKNNLFKDDAINKIEVKPTSLSSEIKSVEANSIVFYHMAIPLFALNTKGKLKINFSERNGMRDVTVSIFSNKIANLKYVGDDYYISNSQTKN